MTVSLDKPSSSRQTLRAPQNNNNTLKRSPSSQSAPLQTALANITSSSASSGGGSGLLLRLFQSEFFNVHLAISYLKNYSDSIGITYYLINRLDNFPEEEVEFYWPQLCHLLISRPTESFALESFIIKKCQRSTHLAVKTLWYLQSSLSDLSSAPTTPSFVICRRTFNRIQSIIFSDPLLELQTHRTEQDPRIIHFGSKTSSESSNAASDRRLGSSLATSDPKQQSKISVHYLRQAKKHALAELTKLKGGKINEKILPSAVGLGVVLASIASPAMASQLGSIPIEQSRSYDKPVDISQATDPVKTPDDNSASEEEAERTSSTISKSALRGTSTLKGKTPIASSRSQSSNFTTTTTPKTSARNQSRRGQVTHDPRSLSPKPHAVDMTTPGSRLTTGPTPATTSESSAASSSSSSAPFSPSWIDQNRNEATDPSVDVNQPPKPVITTAPITRSEHLSHSSAGLATIASLAEDADENDSIDHLRYWHRPKRQQTTLAIPSPSPYSSHFNKLPTDPRPTSPRGRHSSAVSQSAPSLPDTLTNLRHDSTTSSSGFRSHDPHNLWFGRTGGQSRASSGHSSPVLAFSSALSVEPSLISTSLLSQVLKSQSMRCQLDLITNLQDISTRLVIVPKMARLSALRAELTVLNHSLPKGCCLGMYCPGGHCDSDDAAQRDLTGGDKLESNKPNPMICNGRNRGKYHHRIVRISPNESVVLNSADRAPFLIHVEVLEDHLNFDPDRRSNYEDLLQALKDLTRSSNSYGPELDHKSTFAPSNQFLPDQPQSPVPGRKMSDQVSSCSSLEHRSPVKSLATPGPPSSATNNGHLSPPSLTTRRPSLPRVTSGEKLLFLAGTQSLTESPMCNHDYIPHYTESKSAFSTQSFSSRPTYETHASTTSLVPSQTVDETTSPEQLQPPIASISSAATPASHSSFSSSSRPNVALFDFPDEEVDLVEQAYGGNISAAIDHKEPNLFSDPAESSYLPSGLQNKALDEKAWRRVEAARKPQQTLEIGTDLKSLESSGSITMASDDNLSNGAPGPSSPRLSFSSQTSQNLAPPESSTASASQFLQSAASSTLPQTPMSGQSSSGSPRKSITLDEYAERMRMAAIMLAQLNASQQVSQPLAMTPSSAAGMVVGGAIGLGAGFVGVTVGAGLGAVVSRKLIASKNQTSVIRSPIGRKDASGLAGQATSGLKTQLDTSHAASGSKHARRPGDADQTDIDIAKMREALTNGQSKTNSSTGMARPKLLTAQQSQAIKDKIMAEMMALEEERMQRMKLDSISRAQNEINPFGFNQSTSGDPMMTSGETADEAVVMKAVNEDDPSGSMLGESWAEKRKRIKSSSPYGHLTNWNVFSVIVKTGADLRQEQLVTQLIKEFGRIWKEEKCNVWVRYYRIMVTGESTGLMETIVDAVSLHSLKKTAYARISAKREALPNYTMFDYYLETFGQPTSITYQKAQESFMRSLVAYSIISYLLQIKDRHNGNILIDKEGHVIHIDFGFVLSNSPGSLGFEMAPFKLSQDYIEILGGLNGKRWLEFIQLFKVAFKKVRKHAERIITIVELMQADSRLPCFGHGESTVKNLRERFQLGLTSEQTDQFVEKLILSSASSVFTKLYDSFQYYSQGVL